MNQVLLEQKVARLEAEVAAIGGGGGDISSSDLRLVAVRTGTGDDLQALEDAEALRVALGWGGLLFYGTYTFDAGGLSDSSYLFQPASNSWLVGSPGNRLNIINTTTGASENGVDLFRTASFSSGQRFKGLNFWGDNGTDEDSFTPQDQNQNSCICTGYEGVSDVLVEDCTFQFLWGFSIHDVNPANENVSTRNNKYICCGNGVNVNASWSEHSNGYFFLSEGYELGGGATLVQNNRMRNVLGIAITIGGDQSGNWYDGSEVIGNTIDTCTGAAITVTDGMRGAIIANNKASRCDLGALIMHGAITPPERCTITNNIFFSNCKSPGANLVGMDIRDSTVGGHSIIGNRCYDAGLAGYGQDYGMSLSVPDCKVFGNFFGGSLHDAQFSAGADDTDESGNTFEHNTQYWGGGSRLAEVATAINATDCVWRSRLHNLSSLEDRAYFGIRADGYLSWGNNLDLLDTNLYRSAADTLKTDDSFVVGAALSVGTSRKINGASFNFTADIETGWSLARKPNSAHADDEEFEGTLSAWTTGGSQQATAIDPYANFTTGTQWRYSINAFRPSWLVIQPTADGAYMTPIHKAVTVGTNLLVWARLSFCSRSNSTQAANDQGIALVLSASSSSAPDFANYVALYLNETDANEKAIQWESVASGVAAGGTPGELLLSNTLNVDAQYVAIQKIGTTYHFWIAGDSGNWLWLTSVTNAAAMDRVALRCSNGSTNSPGNMLVGCDFIRFYAGADKLP